MTEFRIAIRDISWDRGQYVHLDDWPMVRAFRVVEDDWPGRAETIRILDGGHWSASTTEELIQTDDQQLAVRLMKARAYTIVMTDRHWGVVENLDAVRLEVEIVHRTPEGKLRYWTDNGLAVADVTLFGERVKEIAAAASEVGLKETVFVNFAVDAALAAWPFAKEAGECGYNVMMNWTSFDSESGHQWSIMSEDGDNELSQHGLSSIDLRVAMNDIRNNAADIEGDDLMEISDDGRFYEDLEQWRKRAEAGSALAELVVDRVELNDSERASEEAREEYYSSLLDDDEDFVAISEDA